MANVEQLQRALDFPWEKWTASAVILSSANWWSETMRVRRALPGQQALARPLSHCTGLHIWRAPTLTREFC